MLKAKHLLVSGKVQGVWYRKSFSIEAVKLGIVGWVQNLPNGTVEACIQGEEEDLEKLIAYAGKGPLLAKVTEVKETQAEVDSELTEFLIQRD